MKGRSRSYSQKVTARARCEGSSTRSPRPASRLQFLDGLRGVAVALVLVQHVGERAFPAVAELTHSSLLLGQLGVMVFFLCSGFIIPASLERERPGEGRGRRFASFWRGRFFRLFPLYWLSLAVAGWLAYRGTYSPAAPMSGGDWLANGVMFQMLVGVPNALVAYWTLAFELLFYAGLSVLFVFGLHRRSVELSLAASAVCLALALGAGPLLGAAPPTGAFCLATMLTGTVFHRWHSGEIGLSRLVLCVVAALGSGTALLAAATLGAPQPPEAPQFLAMLTAWLGAYAVFCAGVALRHRRVPAALSRLGTISYSVYLMQALVLAAVPALSSAVGSAVVWVGATLVVSELTYRFVERPAIALGRRRDTVAVRPAAAAQLPVPVRLPAPVPVPVRIAAPVPLPRDAAVARRARSA